MINYKQKTFIFIIMLGFGILTSFPSYASNKSDNLYITNNLFSLELPAKVKKYTVRDTENNGIFIYEKDSKRKGFGGFAFGLKAYEKPADHAMMPGARKIGELIGKNGTIYDMVLLQPTDVQCDYEKGMTDSYRTLYELGNSELKIEGCKDNKYIKNHGMKGEDLYKEVLQKHITAIKEKWNSAKLEKENMSYMYNVLRSGATRGSKKNINVLDKVGYVYYDLNGDGIEELLIGEIREDSLKGVIYDIYTMVDRKPTHVISGGNRERYFACNEVFLCKEYSAGAAENGWLITILVENSTELFPQVHFKYDGYKNKTNPWFISYNVQADKWDSVSQEFFNERKSVFDRYIRFDFIPLSKYK